MNLRIHALSIVLICCLLAGSSVFSQDAPKRLDPTLLNFFIGNWSGEGAFANGNKIAADLSFSLSLDSCWLVYEHRDRAPHHYKATSMWGVDGQSGEFVAYCFDNFQGHRMFEVTEQREGYEQGRARNTALTKFGWRDGRLILSHHGWLPKLGLYFEHFIYERMGDRSFKMSYETSRDGISWQLGDSLRFTKAGE